MESLSVIAKDSSPFKETQKEANVRFHCSPMMVTYDLITDNTKEQIFLQPVPVRFYQSITPKLVQNFYLFHLNCHNLSLHSFGYHSLSLHYQLCFYLLFINLSETQASAHA